MQGKIVAQKENITGVVISSVNMVGSISQDGIVYGEICVDHPTIVTSELAS